MLDEEEEVEEVVEEDEEERDFEVEVVVLVNKAK